MAISLFASGLADSVLTPLIRQGLSQNAIARSLRAEGYTFANAQYRAVYRELKAATSFTTGLRQLDPRRLIPKGLIRPSVADLESKYLFVGEVSWEDPLTGVLRTRRHGIHTDRNLSTAQLQQAVVDSLQEKWGASEHYRRALDSLRFVHLIDVFELSPHLQADRARRTRITG